MNMSGTVYITAIVKLIKLYMRLLNQSRPSSRGNPFRIRRALREEPGTRRKDIRRRAQGRSFTLRSSRLTLSVRPLASNL